MGILTWVIYGIIGLAFIWLFYQNAQGLKVNLIVYEWRNKKRHFGGVIKGVMRKRYPDSIEKSIVFKYKKTKHVVNVPEERAFLSDMKGIYTLQVVVDQNGNVEFIMPTDEVYETKNVKVEIIERNEKGDIIYEDVYVQDPATGEPMLERVKNKDGSDAFDKEGFPLFQPIKERRPVKQIVYEKVEAPVAADRIIKSDRKLYYLNKKEEIRQKYKQEEKKNWLQQNAVLLILVFVTLLTIYFSYKHIQTITSDLKDTNTAFMDRLTKMIEQPQQITNLVNSDKNEPKPEGYGEKVENP